MVQDTPLVYEWLQSIMKTLCDVGRGFVIPSHALYGIRSGRAMMRKGIVQAGSSPVPSQVFITYWAAPVVAERYPSEMYVIIRSHNHRSCQHFDVHISREDGPFYQNHLIARYGNNTILKRYWDVRAKKWVIRGNTWERSTAKGVERIIDAAKASFVTSISDESFGVPRKKTRIPPILSNRRPSGRPNAVLSSAGLFGHSQFFVPTKKAIYAPVTLFVSGFVAKGIDLLYDLYSAEGGRTLQTATTALGKHLNHNTVKYITRLAGMHGGLKANGYVPLWKILS